MQNHLQDRQQLNELINGWMHRDWGNSRAGLLHEPGGYTLLSAA
ncbi:hypothetical protein [Citrobacter braakii]|nr:hypothetical protein [Citrobacter braakii]